MKITIECADCETPLQVFTRLEGTMLQIMVEPCPVCIARKIMLADDQEWVKQKLLREGRAA